MSSQNEITTKVKLADDGLGVTLEAMFDGMEGLLKSKTVVGEPIDMGNIKLIPLVEISAGMAGGSFAEAAQAKGAAGMTAKMTPIAMLMVEGEKVRLINIRNQDAVTKLIDLIPEAIDKITGKFIGAKEVEQAEKAAEDLEPVIETSEIQEKRL